MQTIDNPVPGPLRRPGATSLAPFPRRLLAIEDDPRDLAQIPLGLLALVGAVGVMVVQAAPAPLLGWLWLAALYVVIEAVVAAKGRPFGAAGWPALVAMVPLLDPTGIILGATVAAFIAGMAHRMRFDEPYALSGRFLAHVPAVTAGAALLVLGGGGETGWMVIVAGAVAGSVIHLQRWVLPRTTGRFPAGSTLGFRAGWELAEMVLLGATATALGSLVFGAGLAGAVVAAAALTVVAAADHLRFAVAAAQRATVDSLLLAVEAKDLYTRGHCERVAALAVDLGEALGLPAAARHRLETAARLHDFGKVVVDRHLLRKRGRLTADEYRCVQEHATAVGDLLGGIAFLRPVTPIIVEHHTHFDGTAYRDQAAPGPLSLEARILAVADAYDAMTTHRPYRRALRQAYAFDELRRCSGTQFDPEVVAGLIELLGERHPPSAAFGAGSDGEARRMAEEGVRLG